MATDSGSTATVDVPPPPPPPPPPVESENQVSADLQSSRVPPGSMSEPQGLEPRGLEPTAEFQQGLDNFKESKAERQGDLDNQQSADLQSSRVPPETQTNPAEQPSQQAEQWADQQQPDQKSDQQPDQQSGELASTADDASDRTANGEAVGTTDGTVNASELDSTSGDADARIAEALSDVGHGDRRSGDDRRDGSDESWTGVERRDSGAHRSDQTPPDSPTDLFTPPADPPSGSAPGSPPDAATNPQKRNESHERYRTDEPWPGEGIPGQGQGPTAEETTDRSMDDGSPQDASERDSTSVADTEDAGSTGSESDTEQSDARIGAAAEDSNARIAEALEDSDARIAKALKDSDARMVQADADSADAAAAPPRGPLGPPGDGGGGPPGPPDGGGGPPDDGGGQWRLPEHGREVLRGPAFDPAVAPDGPLIRMDTTTRNTVDRLADPDVVDKLDIGLRAGKEAISKIPSLKWVEGVETDGVAQAVNGAATAARAALDRDYPGGPASDDRDGPLIS